MGLRYVVGWLVFSPFSFFVLLSFFLSFLCGLTETMLTARIIAATITKAAPLNSPINVIFLRKLMFTFHSSYCGEKKEKLDQSTFNSEGRIGREVYMGLPEEEWKAGKNQ